MTAGRAAGEGEKADAPAGVALQGAPLWAGFGGAGAQRLREVLTVCRPPSS